MLKGRLGKAKKSETISQLSEMNMSPDLLVSGQPALHHIASYIIITYYEEQFYSHLFMHQSMAIWTNAIKLLT